MPRDALRYARSADGVNLAWAVTGVGPKVLVLPPNAITDIQTDWENPVRGPMLAALTAHFKVVRFDHRGMGSSDRKVMRHGLDAWVEDIEAVVEAAGLDAPFAILGISQGAPATAAYVARHPERVSHFVANGASRRGYRATGIAGLIEHHNARLEMVRVGWDRDHPGVRLLMTSELAPHVDTAEYAYIQAQMRRAAFGEDVVRQMEASTDVDVREILPRIRTPTLVTHTTEVIGGHPQNGRNFASSIPGAEYLLLPGGRHIITPDDVAFQPLQDAIVRFVKGRPDAACHNPLDALSPRERDILDGVCEGLSNEAIGLQRNISAKTVRNHLTQIFDKLGVMSRTQAAVMAMRATGKDAERPSPVVIF